MEVLRAGMLDTVQDLGRDGLSHLGISPAGAADPLLLRAGNVLLGNPESAAAIEITGWGGHYRFDAETRVTICGGFPVSVEGVTRQTFTPISVSAGAVVRVGSADRGFRGYLCVENGVDVPAESGSRSTHLPSRIGGFEGRALRAGDRVRIGRPGADCDAASRRTPIGVPPFLREDTEVIRVTPGQHSAAFGENAMPGLCASPWRVQAESDRMGTRLFRHRDKLSGFGTILSEGVPAGAVQLTPSGELIVLGADAQTTGGYPILACVISADRRLVAQRAPGTPVRFAEVSFEEARDLLMERERWFYEWKESL